MSDAEETDVLILGSGPAGTAAAVYSARALLKTVVLSGPDQGQLTTTSLVENYLGFESVSGWDLSQHFLKHAQAQNAEVKTETVVAVERYNKPPLVEAKKEVNEFAAAESPQPPPAPAPPSEQSNPQPPPAPSPPTERSNGGFLVSAKSEENGEMKRYRAQAVIVATGARPRMLAIKGEAEYWHKGVSSCVVCDSAMPRFRNKPLAIVGGGDSALEGSLFLTRFSPEVYLIHRSDKFRASAILLQRAQTHPRIRFLTHTVVKECKGTEDKGLTELVLVSTALVVEAKTSVLPVSGLFLAVGHLPNTEFLKSSFPELLDEEGYVVADIATQATAVRGLYASGDCRDKTYRQAITASAEGCKAAIQVARYLE